MGARNIAFVQMADKEDWLLRPVRAHLVRYESLLDGTVNLDDISRLNELLDVEEENQARMRDGA